MEEHKHYPKKKIKQHDFAPSQHQQRRQTAGWSRGKEVKSTGWGLGPLGCINMQLHDQGTARVDEGFEEAGHRIRGQDACTGALPGDHSLLSGKHLFRLQPWSFSEYLHPKQSLKTQSRGIPAGRAGKQPCFELYGHL